MRYSPLLASCIVLTYKFRLAKIPNVDLKAHGVIAELLALHRWQSPQNMGSLFWSLRGILTTHGCMTGRGSHQLTQWQRDRLAFIEHRLYWHGSIGPADLMEVMGISRAQASKPS